MNGWTIALLIAGVVVAWVLFWIALVRLIARFGGWRALADAYPSDRIVFDGVRFRMQSLLLCRWVSYNRCVTFTVNGEGLCLMVLPVFKPGHRPIFLPWSEVAAVPVTRWRTELVRLESRRLPGVPITILRSLADQMAEAAGDRWPGDAVREVEARV